MEKWKEYKATEYCLNVTDGTHDSPKRVKEGMYLITSKYIKDNKIDFDNAYKISEEDYNQIIKRSRVDQWDIIISMIGAYCGYCYIETSSKTDYAIKNVGLFKVGSELKSRWLYYYLISPLGKQQLSLLRTGSSQPYIALNSLRNLSIPVPGKNAMQGIVAILKSLDDKIEINRRINDNFVYSIIVVMLILLLTSLRNDNLEQQAQAVFDKVFPAIASGEDTIGSMITPKRGKGLLSKDAVEGNVPVVAGGLEPSTYHNESNTIAPVITISASGANAGYVNLWHIPVWSSDSSFIDGSMTENVYFWYVMLKKRQKEIFDAQTGSAQPHIYPRHIAEMPLGKFEQPDVDKFTEIVTPMFEIRGKNMKESERLASIRDTLLPKLMSGELKLENINM